MIYDDDISEASAARTARSPLHGARGPCHLTSGPVPRVAPGLAVAGTEADPTSSRVRPSAPEGGVSLGITPAAPTGGYAAPWDRRPRRLLAPVNVIFLKLKQPAAV